MLIPKKARIAVYSYLFKEGVLTVKKDLNAPKHHEIDVPNLYVIKLMQSFKSRGFVTERFNWQWFYFYLTNEGILHLREYLHLPDEIIPATLKKPRAPSRPSGGEGAPRGRGGYGGRGGFRGGFGDQEGKKVTPSEFTPEFKGGEGRGEGRGERGRGRGGERGGFRGRGGERGGYRRDTPAGDRGGRGGRGRGEEGGQA